MFIKLRSPSSNSAGAANLALFYTFFCGVLLPPTAFSSPDARLSVSRASGPAPLAVFFDATQTTHADVSVEPFSQLGYMFVFDDANSGTWQHSGLGKNQQIGGPLAAHVFESPGTYTVQVIVKDDDGAVDVATQTINVQPADVVYAGRLTVCLSRTTDFSGCPSGANQLGNLGSWPRFESNHRYLLRNGQDFSSLGPLNFGPGSGDLGLVDAQMGAFGSGDKPLIGNLGIDSGNTGVDSWHRRVVISDLDVRNIVQTRAGIDLLVFRNTVTRGGMIDIASAFTYWVEHSSGGVWQNPENIFLVENDIDRNFSSVVWNNPSGITGNATRFVILGNSVDRTEQHNVRIWQAHKAFIAHNRITGVMSSSTGHALKFHSGGLDAVQSTLSPGTRPRQRTSQVVISNNILGSPVSNINWIAVTAPQNNQSAEGLEFVIWEDNQFLHGANYFRDITWAGRQMTERGNVNSTDGGRPASAGIAGELGLPQEWDGPYHYGMNSKRDMFDGTLSAPPRSPVLIVD